MMRNVHAKDRRHNVLGFDPDESEFNDEVEKTETKSVDLHGISARVDRVNVEGLRRTRDDIVANTVKDLFNARNFEEVIKKAHAVRQNLQKLGCFKTISIHIDTGSTPSGFEVNYDVVELKRISGGVTTQVSNGQGVFTMGTLLPNMFGRGESLKGEMSYGFGESSTANVTFVKPSISKYNVTASLAAFKAYNDFGASGYNLLENGALLEFAYSSFPGWNHKLQYELDWRKMGAGTKQTSFFIRDSAGSTLKSSIKHVWTVDSRNSNILPACGKLMQMTNEFAGIGGNVNFLKNEIKLQANASKGATIFQAGFNIGLINPIGSEEIAVMDAFFLGGPMNLRGFKGRGVGPKSGDNFIGANMYWAGALHAYFPLPFNPGEGTLTDLFKLHCFINAGNIGAFDVSGIKNFITDQTTKFRLSVGAGLVLKLGNIARLELNYVIPLKKEESDGDAAGIQFGLGVDFL